MAVFASDIVMWQVVSHHRSRVHSLGDAVSLGDMALDTLHSGPGVNIPGGGEGRAALGAGVKHARAVVSGVDQALHER